MESSELIARLSEDLEPSNQPPSLLARIAGWTAAMLLFSVVIVLVLGTRADIHSIMFTPRFIVESLAILVAGITAGILALILSSPGTKTKSYSITAVGAGVIWVGSVAIAFFLQLPTSPLTEGFQFAGIACSEKVIVLAVLPAFFLTALLRMGTAVAGKTAGALVLITAGICGVFTLQFSCSMDHSAHLMVYHVLPVAALGLLGWYLGSYLCGFEARLKKKKKQILGEDRR